MLDVPPVNELLKNEAIADVSTIEDHITGQAYWRSLEEQANAPELLEQLSDEFSGYDPEEIQSVSRRSFLKLAGASLALAGLTLSGCRRWPKEELAPFAARPEDLIPGVPNYFASMTERGGVAHPMLVASFDGRPIKVESHPKAGYATDIYDQASILQQYDPERLRDVLIGKGESRSRSSWTSFESKLNKLVEAAKADGGAKFAVLSEPTSSPTALRLKAKFKAAMPNASWVTYEALGQDNAIAGSKLAFDGKAVRTQYDVAKAKVIACFDCDFLSNHPSATKNAKGWAMGRKSADDKNNPSMNRMYVVESGMTVTGSAADERLPIKPSRVAALLTYVGFLLGVSASTGKISINASEKAFGDKLAKDLKASGSSSIVVAGPNQPADVHAYVHAINKKLGTLDVTTTYSDEPTSDGSDITLSKLVEKMNAEGGIETLLILGGNPVFDAPADLKFSDALGKVKNAIKLGLYRDETAAACEWALPAATSFESWGDGRWYDGTVAVQQPLILPLFNGRSAIELLASVLSDKSLKQPAGYDLVRDTFKEQSLLAGAKFADHLVDKGYASELKGFEKDWRRAVHMGFVPGSALKKVYVDASNVVLPGLKDSAETEVVFAPSAVYDGRFANSPWLQECPDPITKVTWDNPLLLSVPDMKKAGLINGDKIEITVGGATVEAMVFGQPGQAVGTVIAHVGNGRNQQAGSVGQDVGFDLYPLRQSTGMGFAKATVTGKTGSDYLAYTSVHHLVDGLSPEVDDTSKWALEKRAGKLGKSGTKGNVIKEGSFKDYKKDYSKVMGHPHGDLSLQLYESPSVFPDGSFDRKHPDGPEAFNEPHAWGMTIDLSSCIGCNACVVACQAENNIPTVGKKQVWRSREMHWLRTDTYFKGDPDKPEEVQVVHQPIACV
ncbi:MAG: TAT-variant-translocated molybdopterin oxidoreductase, partial [Phycisphaeraceae bacterium]